MHIVLDQGTPARRRAAFSTHDVSTAFDRGWGQLKNGELLTRAEAAGFDVLVTTDQNLRYQQNVDVSGRRIAIVVGTTTSRPRISKALGAVTEAVESVTPGSFIEVPVP